MYIRAISQTKKISVQLEHQYKEKKITILVIILAMH